MTFATSQVKTQTKWQNEPAPMLSRASSEAQDVVADVIVLGSTLPGIVTAYKLKAAFGDTMDVLLLDAQGRDRRHSKFNVAFSAKTDDAREEPVDPGDEFNRSAVMHLSMYAKEFDLPLPQSLSGRMEQDQAHRYAKIFQHSDGAVVGGVTHFNDFSYLRLTERFELSQFHNYLDNCIADLFGDSFASGDDRLRQFDQTTMERTIRQYLIFPTSRDVMRLSVRLVCGAAPDAVSTLFYLHQCFRTKSSRNHLDGHNIRLREKLRGSYRKRLVTKLRKSVAVFTTTTQRVEHIGTNSEGQVVLETGPGEGRYLCDMLAVALPPDQLAGLRVQEDLTASGHIMHIAQTCTAGVLRKFQVQYAENFWRPKGFSGDIFSLRGPIAWAIELPTPTHHTTYRPCIIGLLHGRDVVSDSRADVVAQLVQLFGDEAAAPVGYLEGEIWDISHPPLGEYIGLLRQAGCDVSNRLTWGALDLFADGDVAASIEAGHMTYLHVVRCLRPQALDFDEVVAVGCPKVSHNSRVLMWLSQVGYAEILAYAAVTSGLIIGYRMARSAYKS